MLAVQSSSLRLSLRSCMCSRIYRHISCSQQNSIYFGIVEETQWKVEYRNMTSIFSYVSQRHFCSDTIYPPKFSDVRNLNKGILFPYHNIWVKIWLWHDICRTAGSRSNYSHIEKNYSASGIHKPVAAFQTISKLRNNVIYLFFSSWYVFWLFVGLHGFKIFLLETF